MNKLLSGSSLSTGWFCLGLDASLFELKIIIKEGVQQARMMLLKLPINCEWRRGGREAILWYHSEIHTYFPLFSAYQELMVSSEMTAWILSEQKLMGSILFQWLCRKEHQRQREVLEEQQICRDCGVNPPRASHHYQNFKSHWPPTSDRD